MGEPVSIPMSELHFTPVAALFEGRSAGAGISAFIVRTPPGDLVHLHTHPYPETFFLLAGTGRWTAGDAVVEAVADQVIVVPPDTPHGFRNTGDVPLLVVSIHESPVVRQSAFGDAPA